MTTVYPSHVTCTINGEVHAVPWRQFQLLMCLMGYAGRWVPAAEIERQIWGDKYCDATAVAQMVHHLRKRIGRHLIQTGHKKGYRVL
jgi:DNA-binding response OmpR family regulator